MSKTEQPFKQLADWQQIAYGAAMVERMYINFDLFAELTNSPGQKEFRSILNLVWEYATGKNSRIDFQKQLDKLEVVTPEPLKFDVYGVWPALDAAVGLSSLLSACSRSDPLEIAAIETLSEGTIENYLQAIDEHSDQSLYEADREFKKEVLQLLTAAKNSRRGDVLLELKRLVTDWGVSNIGISLI